MRNIVAAVRALPDPASVAVVGVGSVAQTGNRNPPHHWGRVGDPIRVSQFDEYGQSKVVAERLLVDSGLPKWVQLRQTGIFHPGMLEIRDPISIGAAGCSARRSSAATSPRRSRGRARRATSSGPVPGWS